MLSAVENFGPAAAAAPTPHVYAHHHPFAIAAAAAAAGSAAAAAAAVMPSQTQTSLEHYTIAHSPLLASQGTLGNTGLFLPPSQISTLPSTQGSPGAARSPQLNSDQNASVAGVMSSAEFARPHPKQPRYTNNNNNNNNSNISNNNINSNGIPLHLRNTKISSNCHSGSIPSSRAKYSSEQSGPVNLATNNNNSSNSSIHSNNTPPPNIDTLNAGSTASHQSVSNEADVMAGIYAQKLPYPTPPVVTNTAAAAAAAYQFNYPHIYGRGAIYGTSALYPSHPLSSRSQLHSRPTYIGAQHEPFSPYLPPSVTYSPPSVPPPPGLLRPPLSGQSLALGNPHSTANLLNNTHSNNTSSLCVNQIPMMPDRQHLPMHQVSPPGLVSTDRSQTISAIREKDSLKNSSSYLNGKMNLSTPNATAGFKVPCGKEGSMKHRILTRPPYGERDPRRRSPITTTLLRSSSSGSAPSNFSKGAFIELSNGVLRRVEDMRTEDFIQSAEKSPHHQLADSTVVKIVNTPNSVIITFSYDKNRSKADVEVFPEHPFFVYGQGWASCNPELSIQAFGLKCQRLQVGDVCISLIARESQPLTTQQSLLPSSLHASTSYSSSQLYKEEAAPQNLSRKSQASEHFSTVPTTATGTAVSSRLSAPMPPHLSLPPAVSHIPLQPYEIHPYQTSPPLSRHHSSPPSSIGSMVNSLPPHLHHHRPTKQISVHEGHMLSVKCNTEVPSSPPPSSSAPPTRPPSNQPYYLGTSEIPRSSSGGAATDRLHQLDGHHLTLEQQAAVEASLSRKRRWSAPDICDDEGCQPTPSKTSNKS